MPPPSQASHNSTFRCGLLPGKLEAWTPSPLRHPAVPPPSPPAAHAASDLDVASFCNQHDAGVAGFYAWRRRLAAFHSSLLADPEPPRLVRLEPAPASERDISGRILHCV